MTRTPQIMTVVASAGAGKTTRIVGEISREVLIREPEDIVATTFTVKAADELIERARAALYADDQPDKAARLLGARFGTVNSICAQIVAENALDLGRSPRADIIPEESLASLFNTAASSVIESFAPIMNHYARRFSLEAGRSTDAERSDWRATVRRIVGLARANGLDSQGLIQSGQKSIETFGTILPDPAVEGAASLDLALKRALEAAASVSTEGLSVGGAKSAKEIAAQWAQLKRGEDLNWADWVRLSNLSYAKKDPAAFQNAVDDLTRAAARHADHPKLRSDCADFIEQLFACAAKALDAFQSYKAQHGLLDFTDQEALALSVLQDPVLAERLSERISRVFVDEFQDSSPLQIAIFTEMAKIVDCSTWVGDPKQAIYGFRNADSALTQAAFAGVAAQSSEPADVLSTSYRSRKGIVEFVNAAFAPAFEAMGLPASEHSFKAAARSDDGFHQPPFAVWPLEGTVAKQLSALATGVRDVLENAADWPVADKDGTGTIRPAKTGDIAVLCRSKANIATLAGALAGLGVKVAVERDGLVRTAHVELIMAAFRWVADRQDRLALAELARFFDENPTSDLWLQAVAHEEQDKALSTAVPISEDLEDLRTRTLTLTPAEMVDAIIGLPTVRARLESWGELEVRLDDLEALRGFARAYEGGCTSSGKPATLNGLIAALNELSPQRPKSLQPDAVKLFTYHGAKGLEWPLVILTGLNKEPIPRLYEPVACAQNELDWQKPLADRWIRFWPWPYGGLSKNIPLIDHALHSDIGAAALKAAREEETRLLYVGATRARDYLIFAPPAKGDLDWLRVLDTEGVEHLTLPSASENKITVGDQSFGCRNSPQIADDTETTRPLKPTFRTTALGAATRPALRRRPSQEAGLNPYKVLERIEIGPRLSLSGSPDFTRLGDAVHAILAADKPADDLQHRAQMAADILERWGVAALKPDDVIAASDRLNQFISNRWNGAVVTPEVPVSARLGDQLVSGRIDFLVESGAGLALIDHKSFPGSRDQWDAKAIAYGPQLDLYGQAVEAATGRSCSEMFVHMPVVGVMLRIGPA